MQYLIILCVLLIPIASVITIKGTVVWFPQLLALQLLGGACFASFFWKLNKFIALFIFYLFFSYVIVSFSGMRTMMCLLIGCTAISITLAASTIKNTKWVYVAMSSMAVFSVIYSVLQSFGLDPVFIPNEDRYSGIVSFVGSHNQLGLYSLSNAFWFPWLMPLAIIPIFLAKGNSALIGLVAGAFCYLFFQHGKKYAYGLLVAVLILVVPWWHFCHKSSGELKERINLWKLSIHQIVKGKVQDKISDNEQRTITGIPWVGFGLGSFFNYSPLSQFAMWDLRKEYQYKIPHYYEHAHNDLLEALYEFGYVGFSLVLCIIISVVVLFIKSIKTTGVVITFSSLLAQSVASFSVYVFHAPVSLFMFCLTLGLFYAEVNYAKPSPIKSIA